MVFHPTPEPSLWPETSRIYPWRIGHSYSLISQMRAKVNPTSLQLRPLLSPDPQVGRGESNGDRFNRTHSKVGGKALGSSRVEYSEGGGG